VLVKPDPLKQIYHLKRRNPGFSEPTGIASFQKHERSYRKNLAAEVWLFGRLQFRVKITDPTLNLEPNPAFNAAAKVGQVLVALFVFGLMAFFLVEMVSRDLDGKRELSTLALVMLLLFGPIFAAIVWATRRNLRKAQRFPKKRKKRDFRHRRFRHLLLDRLL
jgi:hypothetical protein